MYLGVGTCVLGAILILDELFLFKTMGNDWVICFLGVVLVFVGCGEFFYLFLGKQQTELK